MTANEIPNNDPKLDLVLHRHIGVSKDKVWRALTEPELIKQWFCPKPWQTVECRVDLRPGGEFYTKMQGPNQESHGGSSCFLEIVPEKKLVWTCSLLPGYRPTPVPIADSGSCDSILFTCVITLVDTAGGTKYTAHVMHASPEQCIAHEKMGFHDGWGAALTQMVEVVQAL